MADQTPIDAIANLLACPCPQHGALNRVGDEFVSACCGKHFRIEDGIPVLLLKEE